MLDWEHWQSSIIYIWDGHQGDIKDMSISKIPLKYKLLLDRQLTNCHKGPIRALFSSSRPSILDAKHNIVIVTIIITVIINTIIWQV